MKQLILILMSCLTLQGCIPLLAGTAVYGVQKGKAVKTERLKVYNRYKMDMEELNMERELKGLEVKKIEDFEEWQEGMAE